MSGKSQFSWWNVMTWLSRNNNDGDSGKGSQVIVEDNFLDTVKMDTIRAKYFKGEYIIVNYAAQ